VNRENIKEIVFSVISSINEELNNQNLKDPTEDTLLFEELDSMAVLDFVMGIEDELQKLTNEYIQIANEHTMDPNTTPFKSIKSSIDYILSKVSQDG